MTQRMTQPTSRPQIDLTPDPEAPLQQHREAYAKAIVPGGDAVDERLIAAFATTPREHYLGPGPWLVFNGSGYVPTLSDDPRQLYQDVLIGIAPERGINNGQPSLHARCIAACAPATGETVLHIGAGTGYYSAILAALVGTGGCVHAYEIEADLAARAASYLQHLPQAKVLAASACEGALPAADVIYVCAGATQPMPNWLDALKPGGRLVFPLTPNQGYGGMLMVTHLGEQRYAATMLMRVAFIPCIGARDAASAAALSAALASQPLDAVRSLHRHSPPDAAAWCAGQGWWLSTEEPA